MRFLVLVPILALSFAGCGPPPADNPTPDRREVTEQDTLEAMSDIHAMSLQALYERIAGHDLTEGRLKLSMGEGANLATGNGRLRITLSHYALPSDSPFAIDYNGYVVTGIIEIDSRGYEGTFGAVELTLRHENPRRYPVRQVEAFVLEHRPPAERTTPERMGETATEGAPTDRGGVAEVRLFVNGRRMPGRLLVGGTQ